MNPIAKSSTAPVTPAEIPRKQEIEVEVRFFSYFKDLAACPAAKIALPAGGTIEDLLERLFRLFPKLAPMRNSMLIAVGLEYQDRGYVLKESDEVALFPPVQGG